MIGNFLQNALEAYQRLLNPEERFIRFDLQMVNGWLMLIMENVFDGTVLEKKGEIVSRKYKGGLGLVGIRRIVSRPGNDIEMHHSEHVFTVMITLAAQG